MKTTLPLLLTALILSAAVPAQAQIFGNQRNAEPSTRDDGEFVTVFVDCNFQGAGRRVPVGDYPNMRAIQFSNDSISSIRVPVGLELNVYQNDNFDGFSSRHTQDVPCLEKAWNDQISSLRVMVNQSQRQQAADTRPGSNYYTREGVNGKTLARVEFADTVLEQVGEQRWRMTGRNGQGASFRELSRNDNAVYLQGERNGEKIRIDFFTQDITILARSGQQANYPMQVALRVDAAYRSTAIVPVTEKPAASVIRGTCFDYTAQARGGQGGIRFYTGDNAFTRFENKPVSGRVCHQGSLVMEINKTSLAAAVTITIQGKTYEFAANEEHDVYLNNWYRKKVDLNVVR